MPLSAMAWQPTKPVEAIIAFTPGSANEVLFRATAAEVEKATGATFVVRNRPGAGGVIGTEAAARAAADGYTLTVFGVQGLAGVDKLQPSHSYTVDSFVYPTHLASNPFAVIAGPNESISNPKQFIEALKTEKVNIAAFGGARLAYEEIQSRVRFPQGIDAVQRIEHKGPVDAMIDVASGNVRFAIIPVSVAAEFYNDRRIKIIALTGNQRLVQMPEVPLLSTALPGYDVSGNWGIALPAGTPADVIEWYNREFVKALKTTSVQSLFKLQLFQENIQLQNPIRFNQFVHDKDKAWTPLIENIKK